MRDPHPENISGQKVQRHVFKHEIQWGYVAISLVAVVVIVMLWRRTASGDDQERNEPDAVLDQ